MIWLIVLECGLAFVAGWLRLLFIHISVQDASLTVAPINAKLCSLGLLATINFCSLFLAGTDTTALTLSWTMYYLVKYPEAFARCRAEAIQAAPERCVDFLCFFFSMATYHTPSAYALLTCTCGHALFKRRCPMSYGRFNAP